MTSHWLDVPAGKYNIELPAENVLTIRRATDAGKNFYVWQEVKMGMGMAISLLQQVDEATGRAAVDRCRLFVQ